MPVGGGWGIINGERFNFNYHRSQDVRAYSRLCASLRICLRSHECMVIFSETAHRSTWHWWYWGGRCSGWKVKSATAIEILWNRQLVNRLRDLNQTYIETRLTVGPRAGYVSKVMHSKVKVTQTFTRQRHTDQRFDVDFHIVIFA